MDSHRESTPTFDKKITTMSFTQLNIGEGDNKTVDYDDWREVFDLLDPKDGVSDGQIDKKSFIEWIDTLSFQVE